MAVVTINYPHPVISIANNDYIDCIFDINEPKIIDSSTDVIDFSISYILTSNGLADLIKEQKAKVTVYLESVESEYRKIKDFPFDSNEMNISINKNDVNNKVIIRGYIVCIEDINNFTLAEHNKDIFMPGSIKVKKGNKLGISNTSYEIPIEVYDPLKDKKSIFSIRLNTELTKDIDVNFTSYDKITIFLNTEAYELFLNLRDEPKSRKIISTLYALPALVDVLNYIKNANSDDLDEIKSRKWYQVLKNRMKELEIDLNLEESMVTVANSLLPHVFNETMKQYRDMIDDMMEDQNR